MIHPAHYEGGPDSFAEVRGEGPSPSALFAHRLMHYCCEEVAVGGGVDYVCESRHVFPLTSRPCHRTYTVRSSEDLEFSNEYDDSIEELADGLDVLMVLERAYDKTLRAHVVSPPATTTSEAENLHPVSANGSSRTPASTSHVESAAPLSSTPPPCSPTANTRATPGSRQPYGPTEHTTAPNSPPLAPQPLREGSSTALLAILDHTAVQAVKPPVPVPLLPRQWRVTDTQRTTSDRAGTGAVLRVAHLGDCMAMLIRGDEIVWRTEEMWWDVSSRVCQFVQFSADDPGLRDHSSTHLSNLVLHRAHALGTLRYSPCRSRRTTFSSLRLTA